jgi:hypothetical protein
MCAGTRAQSGRSARADAHTMRHDRAPERLDRDMIRRSPTRGPRDPARGQSRARDWSVLVFSREARRRPRSPRTVATTASPKAAEPVVHEARNSLWALATHRAPIRSPGSGGKPSGSLYALLRTMSQVARHGKSSPVDFAWTDGWLARKLSATSVRIRLRLARVLTTTRPEWTMTAASHRHRSSAAHRHDRAERGRCGRKRDASSRGTCTSSPQDDGGKSPTARRVPPGRRAPTSLHSVGLHGRCLSMMTTSDRDAAGPRQ